MGIGVIILFCTMALAITALIALLTKSRKDTFHQAARRFVLPPPLVGTTDPHKSGYWYTTNWFAGKKSQGSYHRGQRTVRPSTEEPSCPRPAETAPEWSIMTPVEFHTMQWCMSQTWELKARPLPVLPCLGEGFQRGA